jgi:hypothetical protein
MDLMRIAAVDPKPFDVLLCTSIDRIEGTLIL